MLAEKLQLSRGAPGPECRVVAARIDAAGRWMPGQPGQARPKLLGHAKERVAATAVDPDRNLHAELLWRHGSGCVYHAR